MPKAIHWKRDHIDDEGRLVCPVKDVDGNQNQI